MNRNQKNFNKFSTNLSPHNHRGKNSRIQPKSHLGSKKAPKPRLGGQKASGKRPNQPTGPLLVSSITDGSQSEKQILRPSSKFYPKDSRPLSIIENRSSNNSNHNPEDDIKEGSSNVLSQPIPQNVRSNSLFKIKVSPGLSEFLRRKHGFYHQFSDDRHVVDAGKHELLSFCRFYSHFDMVRKAVTAWHNAGREAEPLVILDVGSRFGNIKRINKVIPNLRWICLTPMLSPSDFTQRSLGSHANCPENVTVREETLREFLMHPLEFDVVIANHVYDYKMHEMVHAVNKSRMQIGFSCEFWLHEIAKRFKKHQRALLKHGSNTMMTFTHAKTPERLICHAAGNLTSYDNRIKPELDKSFICYGPERVAHDSNTKLPDGSVISVFIPIRGLTPSIANIAHDHYDIDLTIQENVGSDGDTKWVDASDITDVTDVYSYKQVNPAVINSMVHVSDHGTALEAVKRLAGIHKTFRTQVAAKANLANAHAKALFSPLVDSRNWWVIIAIVISLVAIMCVKGSQSLMLLSYSYWYSCLYLGLFIYSWIRSGPGSALPMVSPEYCEEWLKRYCPISILLFLLCEPYGNWYFHIGSWFAYRLFGKRSDLAYMITVVHVIINGFSVLTPISLIGLIKPKFDFNFWFVILLLRPEGILVFTVLAILRYKRTRQPQSILARNPLYPLNPFATNIADLKTPLAFPRVDSGYKIKEGFHPLNSVDHKEWMNHVKKEPKSPDFAGLIMFHPIYPVGISRTFKSLVNAYNSRIATIHQEVLENPDSAAANCTEAIAGLTDWFSDYQVVLPSEEDAICFQKSSVRGRLLAMVASGEIYERKKSTHAPKIKMDEFHLKYLPNDKDPFVTDPNRQKPVGRVIADADKHNVFYTAPTAQVWNQLIKMHSNKAVDNIKLHVKGQYHVYFGSMNHHQLGELVRIIIQDYPVMFSNDFRSYDSSNQSILYGLDKLSKSVLKCSRGGFGRTIETTFKGKCFTQTRTGGTKSGDQFTTCGNTLINWALFHWVMKKNFPHINYVHIAMGDDGLLFCDNDSCSAEVIWLWLYYCGYQAKIKLVKSLGTLDFVSAMPCYGYNSDGVLVLTYTPLFFKCVLKLFYTDDIGLAQDAYRMNQYIREIVTGMRIMAGHNPLFHTLLSRLGYQTTDTMEYQTFWSFYHDDSMRALTPANAANEQIFHDRYGMPLEIIIQCLEACLPTVIKAPCIIDLTQGFSAKDLTRCLAADN